MSSETSGLPLRAASPSRRLPSVAGSARGAAARLLPALRAGYWAEAGLVAALLGSLAIMRIALQPWQTADYTTFLVHWFDFLRANGFHGLGQEFANYNMPYLYLLYVGTLLPVDALTCVKTIGALSDVALALGCFALLKRLGLGRELALIGGAAVLMLPEVLLNSAAWGQADSTYTAFLVWALWAALGDRQRLTWLLFGVAFAFKLQAAFVLPAFVVLHVTKRWSWQGPVVFAATVLATELPALVAGRSPASLLNIYFDQANGFALLSMNAPNLYALMPESQHDTIRSAGMAFALASVALLSYLVLRAARRRALDGTTAVLFVAALATVAPYTLPTMHERYFYVANVLLFVVALKDRKLLPWALVAQGIAVSAYSPFLFGSSPVVSMGALAFAEAALLFVVVRHLVRAAGLLPAIEPAPAEERTPASV